MPLRIDDPIDPEGKRLPIKLDSTSNGEFVPVPLSATNRAANRLAHEHPSAFSKKLALSRKSFLVSACGAASTLLALNQANAAAGVPSTRLGLTKLMRCPCGHSVAAARTQLCNAPLTMLNDEPPSTGSSLVVPDVSVIDPPGRTMVRAAKSPSR